MGDSLVRRLTLEAEGAQAMRMLAPQFDEVEGLQRYVRTPEVGPLGDGRGHVSGGRRVDEASYVIDQAGKHQLPAVELQWWALTANQMRTATVPAQDFEASAEPTYQASFSMTDGARRPHPYAQYWLLLAALLVLGGLVSYWGCPGWSAARSFGAPGATGGSWPIGSPRLPPGSRWRRSCAASQLRSARSICGPVAAWGLTHLSRWSTNYPSRLRNAC